MIDKGIAKERNNKSMRFLLIGKMKNMSNPNMGEIRRDLYSTIEPLAIIVDKHVDIRKNIIINIKYLNSLV